MTTPASPSTPQASPSTPQAEEAHRHPTQQQQQSFFEDESPIIAPKSAERPLWSSKWAYLLALLSVQLSQLWRGAGWIGSTSSGSSSSWMIPMSFLYMALSMLLVGLPLLVLELALGQAYQEGAVGIWQAPCFGHKRLTVLGLVSLFMAFIMACYGVGILSWMIHAFVDTFRGGDENASPGQIWTQDWDEDGYDKIEETRNPYTSTADYFFGQIIGQSTLTPTRLVVDNVVYAAFTWILIWAGTSIGVSKMGRISMILTGVATILLVTLWGASFSLSFDQLNLDNSNNAVGRQVYHSSGDLLSEAVTQTIYIVGLSTGIMATYASYNPTKKESVTQVASGAFLFNTLFLLITGYAIAMAIQSDDTATPIFANPTNTDMGSLHPGIFKSIFSSVFIQWPTALSSLGGNDRMDWVRLVFVTFFLLGIHFPLAVLTSILTVLRDANTVSAPRWKVAGFLSILGFLLTLVFTTDAGFMFMECLDYYVTFVLLLIAFLETFTAGWLNQGKEQVEKYGVLPIVFYALSNFGSVLVASTVWFGFKTDDQGNSNRLWVGFLGACAVFLLGLACTILSLQYCYNHRYLANLDPTESAMSPQAFYVDFCYENVLLLKDSLEPAVGAIPTLWCQLIKQVVPQVLLLVLVRHVLLSIDVFSPIGFSKYYGLPFSPVQIVGILVLVLAVIVCLLGMAAPQLFSALIPLPTTQFVNRRDTMEDTEDTSGNSSDSMDRLEHMEEPVVLDGDDDAIE